MNRIRMVASMMVVDEWTTAGGRPVEAIDCDSVCQPPDGDS